MGQYRKHAVSKGARVGHRKRLARKRRAAKKMLKKNNVTAYDVEQAVHVFEYEDMRGKPRERLTPKRGKRPGQ